MLSTNLSCRIVIVLLIGLFTTTIAFAQERVENKPDHFDFMLGEWTIAAKIRNSPVSFQTGEGVMKVYKDKDTILADMNIKFAGFNVVGTTKRLFDADTGRWNIGWFPQSGPSTPDIEGLMLKNRFIEFNYGTDNRGGFIGRLVIYNISKDRFSVRKDRLYDDGTLLPDIWAYEATRIKPAESERSAIH